MTTIVAVENKNHVLLGCDTQVTTGYQKESMDTAKIFSNGEYRIGGAGRLRMLQALKHADLPEIPKDETDLDKFVSRILGPFVSRLEKQVDCKGEGVYLFVLRNRVYLISGDGTYLRNSSKRYSIGSGSAYALGALYGIDGQPTREDVYRALRAAAKNDIGTSSPFHVEKVTQ